MAATPPFRDLVGGGGGLPSILIDSKSLFRDRGPASLSRYSPPTEAICIPSASQMDDVPPPLPPPRYLPPFDGPTPEYHGNYQSSFNPSWDDRPSYKRRESNGTIKKEHDEGYASLSTASVSSTRSRESLPSLSEFGLHPNRFQIRTAADSYSESLKRKLDPIKTFDNKSPPGRSLLSTSASEFPRRSVQDTRLTPLSVPSTLPFHPRNFVLDSPDRLTQTPVSSALSPRSAPFPGVNGHDNSDMDRSPPHRSQRTNSDDATVSTQGSYELNAVDDMEIDGTPSLRNMHIDDSMRPDYQTAGIGQKRRALSPPKEEHAFNGIASQGDLFRRREITSRDSPNPRLSSIPQGSISSVSTGRSGSYASNYSMTASSMASSMTSLNSYGHRSPSALSSGGVSPIPSESCSSPYATSISLTTSPRTPLPRPPHQRAIGDNRQIVSPRKLDVSKTGVSRVQGPLMCGCCPKKPKKFETAEELSAHEAEKQYECSFCGNRFKNKNEAERHQNSLHVRRHSWSCSAIQGYDRVFHESPNQPGMADTCGYCGDEFPRTGRGPSGPGGPRHATETDWDDRIRHLQEVHKFRECNASKKFYRADHFRQHLKHSHAGTAGKWTNMLENACMMDEEPPMPR